MIPDTLFDALACGARAAVAEAWQQAFPMSATLGRQPDEVDHVYALTKFGTQGLARHWGKVLLTRGIALRVTAVFCHQTPKAHYAHPTLGSVGPELADLMIVHQHRTPGKRGRKPKTTRRAVLIQAKPVTQGVPRGGTVGAVQEYLYQFWPDFELRGRGSGSRPKTFLKGLRDFGQWPNPGRYGLVEKTAHTPPMPLLLPYCCAFPWTISLPNGHVRTAGGEDAGAFLTNMLFEGTGRGRSATIPQHPLALSPNRMSRGRGWNNHFDVTVEELLTLTANKTLRYTTKGYVRGPRGYEICLCLQATTGAETLLSETGKLFLASSVGPPGSEDLAGEPDDDDGIPILLIETGSED